MLYGSGAWAETPYATLRDADIEAAFPEPVALTRAPEGADLILCVELYPFQKAADG